MSIASSLRRAGLAVIMLALPAAAFAAAPAGSRVSAVHIAGTAPVGTFAKIPYVRIWGTVEGVVAPGEKVDGLATLPKDKAGGYDYANQFEIIAPAPGARPDGVVFVDAENRGGPLSFNKLEETSVAGPPATASYPQGLGNGFLPRHATSYARVQWQTGIAAGVPATAQGVGMVVMRDFARLLRGRTPGAVVSGGVLPPAFHHAIIGGISQSAWLVETFVAESFNQDPRTGHAVFDGAVAIDGTGTWLALNQLAAQAGAAQHPYVVSDAPPLSHAQLLHRPGSDPLFVDVANYTDFYRLRASLTDIKLSTATFRRYDWPSAHAAIQPPASTAIFTKMGCNGGTPMPLNPTDYEPYLRAVVIGIEHGIGVKAAAKAHPLPPTTLFRLGPAPTDTAHFNPLAGVVLHVPVVDANAMPEGGVRFPEDRYPVGKPVPVSMSPVTTAGIKALCGNRGGFQPFTPAELVARYSSQAHYLALYDAAVKTLVSSGYLLAEDEGALHATAARHYQMP